MNRVERERRPADRTLIRQGAPELKPNVTEPTIVVDAESGAAVFVLARLRSEITGPLRAAVRGYPATTTYRMAGSRNVSRTFGFTTERAPMRRSSCRPCSGATDAPAAHATITATADGLAEQLAAILPGQVEQDRARAAAAIRPAWIMGGWWTSGVVNFDSALPYHYDANNLACWSAMPVLRRGVRGGHLHVPEYDLVVDCADGDVCFFAGYDLMHATTPLRRATRDGYRISAVYYTVAGMGRCDEPARRARTRARAAEPPRRQHAGPAGSRRAPMTDAVVVVSHARPDGANARTLRTLADRGVPRELVHVFVAAAEIPAYVSALDPGLYGTLRRGEVGLPGQRRASFRAFPAGSRIVSCDDDVADVRRRTSSKTTEPVTDLMALFARGWSACDSAGATLWGVYPVLNPYFMREGTAVGLLFCVGYMWGAVASRARWAQPTMTCKEDYERCCQRFAHDGAVVRLQDVAVRTKWNAEGGIAAEGGVQNRCRREVAELLERYPGWVTITKRRSERGLEIRLRA